ncbi:uncharacterized protein RMCC_3809 [Mycolicibacterium canariasense]|uniref:Uncharacterized protein n=1 Tax=Mycolicibacterium canariasense TaxID=228230 RepID=A0A124E2H7_MYCCR|nr:uncharacterized protein RMCC_3809 [Mycolicibacterium canariasense]
MVDRRAGHLRYAGVAVITLGGGQPSRSSWCSGSLRILQVPVAAAIALPVAEILHSRLDNASRIGPSGTQDAAQRVLREEPLLTDME